MKIIGVFVITAVCLWLAVLVLIALRSAFFLTTMLWLAALHVFEARRAVPESEAPQAE